MEPREFVQCLRFSILGHVKKSKLCGKLAWRIMTKAWQHWWICAKTACRIRRSDFARNTWLQYKQRRLIVWRICAGQMVTNGLVVSQNAEHFAVLFSLAMCVSSARKVGHFQAKQWRPLALWTGCVPSYLFIAAAVVEPSSISGLLVVVIDGFGVGVQLLLSSVSGNPGDEPLLGSGPMNVEYEWPFNEAADCVDSPK